MESLVRALAALVPAAWALATGAYALVFLRRDLAADRWCRPLAFCAVALHVAVFAALAVAGRPPLVAAGAALFATALAVAVVHLYLEGRAGSRTIGVFPAGLVLLLTIAGAAADPLRQPAGDLPALSTNVHVAGAVLGYSGLLLAALYGVLFLLQRAALRGRRFGLLWERLPALELLDQFSRRSLAAALIFLTLTISFGHVVGRSPGLEFDYWDPKIMVTNLIWTATLLVVVCRRFHWIRPSTSAAASVLIFAFAVVNMLVVDTFSHVHPAY